jgi:NAD(P)-dependent dehydrogenase (short-subunit alcohol dehydrogenase family)
MRETLGDQRVQVQCSAVSGAGQLIAPLHRVAEPDDLAEACLALVATRYATGQTLVVDGGLGLLI